MQFYTRYTKDVAVKRTARDKVPSLAGKKEVQRTKLLSALFGPGSAHTIARLPNNPQLKWDLVAAEPKHTNPHTDTAKTFSESDRRVGAMSCCKINNSKTSWNIYNIFFQFKTLYFKNLYNRCKSKISLSRCLIISRWLKWLDNNICRLTFRIYISNFYPERYLCWKRPLHVCVRNWISFPNVFQLRLFQPGIAEGVSVACWKLIKTATRLGLIPDFMPTSENL